MTLWMVRGDKYGQYHTLALEKGFAYHASQLSDLSGTNSREDILNLLRNYQPDANEPQIRSWGSQLYAIAHLIKKDDLIAMPLKGSPQIAIGKVIGSYQYRTDLLEVHHTIPVEWIKEDIPRTVFGQDLLYSLGSARTICKIQRNDAKLRIVEILKSNKDPGLITTNEKIKTTENKSDDVEDGGQELSDVEQMAFDQIMAHIEKHLKGHNLARLVDAVLQAEGYVTKLSPPGPDGGVDILAGRGTLGFEGPKLCVQVKSSSSSSDVTVLRSLQGSMGNFKADQGLLVSWGGFNKAVEAEARMSFFSVRLWDANDLIDAVIRNYNRLSKELQNELPLKRIWALVVEE